MKDRIRGRPFQRLTKNVEIVDREAPAEPQVPPAEPGAQADRKAKRVERDLDRDQAAAALEAGIEEAKATLMLSQLPARRVETLPAEVQFDRLLAFGTEMVRTGFLPKGITTGAQAAAIILTGREIGIPTMQALRSISIVEGRPTIAADLQLALFKRAGGRAVWKELTDRRAVLQLRHPAGDEHLEAFTIEDAGRANLLFKSNWKNYPKAMLRSRTITAGLKSVGFEACAGLYDPEELETAGLTLPQIAERVEAAPIPMTLVAAVSPPDDPPERAGTKQSRLMLAIPAEPVYRPLADPGAETTTIQSEQIQNPTIAQLKRLKVALERHPANVPAAWSWEKSGEEIKVFFPDEAFTAWKAPKPETDWDRGIVVWVRDLERSQTEVSADILETALVAMEGVLP